MRWITAILLVQTACAAGQTAQVKGVLGGSIRLSPVVPHGFRTRDVLWKHSAVKEELVASFSRGAADTTYRSRFYGRVRLHTNVTLQISGLQPGDSGTFSCHLVDTEGHMALSHFHVTVYEAVGTPLVEVFVLGGTETPVCSVLLSCNASAGSDMSYTWRVNTGQGDPLNASYILYDGGRLLRTVLEPGDSDTSYTCTVANAVSQGHQAVAPWHSCSVGKTGNNFEYQIAVCTAAVILLTFTVLAVCVMLSVSCAGGTQKRVRRVNEEGELEESEEAALKENEEATTQQNVEVTTQQNVEVEPQNNEVTTQQNVEVEPQNNEVTTQHNVEVEPQNQEVTTQHSVEIERRTKSPRLNKEAQCNHRRHHKV